MHDERIPSLSWAKLAENYARTMKRVRVGNEERFQMGIEGFLIGVGTRMSLTADEIKAVNLEVEYSKSTLQKLANEVKALHDTIEPQLTKLVQELRAQRMTVTSEISQSLQAMKDIRKFFLDENYHVEMDRLERFVRLCRALQEVKASGVLDAVSNTMIRLALKEEFNEGEGSKEGAGK